MCNSNIDIFTQEELPEKDFVVLNQQSPYNCVGLETFYDYWKSKANDGQKVKNPSTNMEISYEQLNEIWKKIKIKYPNDTQPVIQNVRIHHDWDENGMQVERRFISSQRPILPELMIPIFESPEISEILNLERDSPQSSIPPNAPRGRRGSNANSFSFDDFN